jgi:hypothetical protein
VDELSPFIDPKSSIGVFVVVFVAIVAVADFNLRWFPCPRCSKPFMRRFFRVHPCAQRVDGGRTDSERRRSLSDAEKRRGSKRHGLETAPGRYLDQGWIKTPWRNSSHTQERTSTSSISVQCLCASAGAISEPVRVSLRRSPSESHRHPACSRSPRRKKEYTAQSSGAGGRGAGMALCTAGRVLTYATIA